ncbi:hypothetical protein L3X38_006848 [Prunus dulcis]|uniref:Uncharacterized protein n=1 Tax=Prunus dulcis TaxID=3755 RepID=A0AAD4ZTM7_PRUDU|nr:hypothetical protein L3X38_006848 [Prunus dulcis]
MISSLFMKRGNDSKIYCIADKSITYPDGIIKDVLVKSILDYWTKTLIDVEEGLRTVRVGNEKATFKVFEPITFHIKVKEKETSSHPLVHASTSKAKKPRVAEPTLYLDEPKPYDLGKNELEELQNKSYESARIYEDHTKKWHDKHIKTDHDDTTFKVKGR